MYFNTMAFNGTNVVYALCPFVMVISSAKKSLKTAYVFYLTNQNFVEQSEQVHGKKIPVDMSMSSLRQDKKVGRFMTRKQIHGQKHAKHVAINSHMKKCNKESVLFQLIMYKTKGVLRISSDVDDRMGVKIKSKKSLDQKLTPPPPPKISCRISKP